MSTENHDQQPAAPEGSAPEGSQAAEQVPPTAPQVPTPSPAPTEQAPASQPAAQPQPVQPVSAPPQELHPQAHATQELQHPQQHATAPYPQQYGGAGPQPQYGQYAPGQHYGHAPYPQQGHQQVPPQPPHRAPYPQQQPAQYPPGASFSNPYLTPASGPDQPGQEPRERDSGERKPRTWLLVGSAAVIAALLASGGTAAVVHGLDGNGTSTSISSLGDPGRVDSAPVKDSTATNPDWQAVTAAVAQSVVSIQVASSQGGAEGSGLILDNKGHILTNNHVVSGAQNDTVQVTLSDGRLFQAKIVGTDPTTDLAVVKIENAPSSLRPVALGNSDDVKVGDPVLAVGNPLGLANTATTGIVSALDRPVTASGEGSSTQVVTNAIQIDAAINPGNSGGPLFDASGRVIGITSSIASLSSGGQSGSIGLGFAIPVNLGKNISAQLIENGSAQHAFLGVSMHDGTATADGVTRRGAQVQEVSSGSPAAAAGIKVGDVVVAIGDQPVSSAESLTAFVREREAGEKVALSVVRGGKAEQITVTLAVRDESTQQNQGGSGDQGNQGGQGGSQQLPPGLGGQGDGGSDGSGSGGSNQGDGGLWNWLFGGN
ncbi:trypsin-like peptidase domain-containing protein [Xylanimonas sp. McL0601]|uniref:S1C family serine protease n=1 Tax=Xylanimonas sp. McL0601 TaxID=3414739 RepID=UPI003CE89EC1